MITRNTAATSFLDNMFRSITYQVSTWTKNFTSKSVLLPWRSGLVRSTSAVGGGEWLWVQAPSMVVGTPCRGP